MQEAKFAGISRYATARGWNAVAVPESDSRPVPLKALLARTRPVGAIVECSVERRDLPPRLFGSIPVVYIDAPPSLYGPSAVRVEADNEAIVRAALRELSCNRPSALAFVGYYFRTPWADARAKAFLAQAAAPRHVFKTLPGDRTDHRGRLARLASWVASLPRHAGVFAVNDQMAADVVRAADMARLNIPRDLTVVGVDNKEKFSAAPDTSITTVRIDFERAGYLAARMLGERVGIAHKSEIANCPHIANSKSNLKFGNCGLLSQLQIAHNVFGPMMVIRRESTRGFGRREPHVLAAVELVRRKACDGLTPAAVAASVPGSRRLFELRFREAMGHSVLEEIQTVQLEKVCTLLSQTDTAISAIADFCGFGSGRALRDLFRARFKMSMREYRMRSRG